VTSSIHPEYLFDLERQASLTDSERALRDQHLQSCVSCRLEHGFRNDFAREPLDGKEDGALLDRAVLGALATITLPPAPRRGRRWVAPAAIGATLLAAGLAAAALRSPRASGPAPAPSVSPAVVRSPPIAPAPVEDVAAPPAPAPPAPKATAPATERPAIATAAQLFARANSARRAGETSEAVRLYRRLLAEFPASREARTSEVTMARLLLDTQADAAEALDSFERYVREAPAGNLAEEARLGRAEALGRLGRAAEEASAWAELLEHFPATVHRGRAEARSKEIAAQAP
jgi:TolA-binding protein